MNDQQAPTWFVLACAVFISTTVIIAIMVLLIMSFPAAAVCS